MYLFGFFKMSWAEKAGCGGCVARVEQRGHAEAGGGVQGRGVGAQPGRQGEKGFAGIWKEVC